MGKENVKRVAQRAVELTTRAAEQGANVPTWSGNPKATLVMLEAVTLASRLEGVDLNGEDEREAMYLAKDLYYEGVKA